MSDPTESKDTHEQWCHDRIQTLEAELACFQDEDRARQRDETGKLRHHDVLCLVLKELVENYSRDIANPDRESVRVHVDLARHSADLAYPPPKVE